MKDKCKKRQKKNKQRHKWARGTEAKGKRWELNDFVVHLRFSPVKMTTSFVNVAITTASTSKFIC